MKLNLINRSSHSPRKTSKSPRKLLAVLAAFTMLSAPVLADDQGDPETRWDGLYGSSLSGYGWAGDQTHFNNRNGFVTDLGDVDGSLFGLGVGWNHTQDRMLFGVEADAMTSNMDASLTDCLGTAPRSCTAEIGGLITVRGRVGMTFGEENQFLVFAAGGLAVFNTTLTTSPPAGGGPAPTVTDSNWQTSWTAGGGAEMFWPGNKWLSSRIEYLYVGKSTDIYEAGANGQELGFGADIHIIRSVLSLHLY
jgi:opacity protein-like surface antigen